MSVFTRRYGLLSLLSTAVIAACSPPVTSNPDVVSDMTSPPGDTGVMEMDGSTPEDAASTDTGVDDAPTPDAPTTPDWGFRPMPHGFAFENYTNMDNPTNLTPVDMRRLLGAAVCEGGAAAGECRLTPQAQQWMERQNTSMNGGHCEGMAVLAGRMFSGASDPMTFGAPTTFGLALMGNTALQREIAVWFATQSVFTTLERRTLTPTQVVAELERDLSRGRAFAGTILGIYKRAGAGGHAISPYLLRRPDANTVEIVTYDNNFVNTERVLTVNTRDNSWRYVASTNPMEPGSLYDGDATTFNLTLIDIGPRGMLPGPCPFCGDAPMDGGGARAVQISMNGQGDLSIQDGMGRTTGSNSMGMPVNSIPGAEVALQRSGNLFQDSPEPLFTVPRATPLTITLDGSRLTSMSPSEVLVMGPGYALEVEGINLDPMQRDTIVVQPGAPDITYRTMGTETPTLVLAFERPGADYNIEVSSTAMTAGQSLRLSVDFAMQQARISFEGSGSAPMLTLDMNRVSDTGEINFRHAGVAATPTTVLFINYGTWGGNGMPLSVGVDTNGDGTIDRTDMLADQS